MYRRDCKLGCGNGGGSTVGSMGSHDPLEAIGTTLETPGVTPWSCCATPWVCTPSVRRKVPRLGSRLKTKAQSRLFFFKTAWEKRRRFGPGNFFK
ncbi:hypothetical protein ACFX10_014062 [Malus domestica]